MGTRSEADRRGTALVGRPRPADVLLARPRRQPLLHHSARLTRAQTAAIRAVVRGQAQDVGFRSATRRGSGVDVRLCGGEARATHRRPR